MACEIEKPSGCSCNDMYLFLDSFVTGLYNDTKEIPNVDRYQIFDRRTVRHLSVRFHAEQVGDDEGLTTL